MDFIDMKQEHLPALAALFAEAFNAPPWNDGWTAERALLRLGQYLREEGARGMVCMEDGAPAGLVLGVKEYYYNADQFQIKEFCVHPRVQGRGVGKELLFRFLQLLREQGIDEVVLMTTRDPSTLAFYEKMGFSVAEPLVFMEKKL